MAATITDPPKSAMAARAGGTGQSGPHRQRHRPSQIVTSSQFEPSISPLAVAIAWPLFLALRFDRTTAWASPGVPLDRHGQLSRLRA